MALKKRYYSMNGRLIAERDKAGQTGRIDYMTDALGSVTATVDQSAQVVNTYRYKPYGGLLAKTGSGSDPKFRWVGSWGYRETSKTFSDVYVRARHYAWLLAAFSTPLRPLRSFYPNEEPYTYCGSKPTSLIDSSGRQPQLPTYRGSGDRRLAEGTCPGGNCDDLQPQLPRPDPRECNLSDPTEIDRLKSCVTNSFCQARALCGGSVPSWCRGQYVPPSAYGTNPDRVAARAFCCYDCRTGKCRGWIVAGPRWPRRNKCFQLCLFEHEYTHVRHCDEHFVPGSDVPPRFKNWTECQAWCNTLACCLKLLARAGVPPPRGIALEDGRVTCGPGFGQPFPGEQVGQS